MDFEKQLSNMRSLSRALMKTGISEKSSRKIAQWICEKADKNTITESDVKCLEFVKAIIGEIDADSTATFTATTAILNGIDNIESTYNYLLSLGYLEEEVKTFFKKDSSAFGLKKGNLEEIYNYLLSLGITSNEVKEIYLKAILLSPENVKNHCECVLSHYDKQLLLTLGKGFLFYGIYSDPLSAIETVYTELGPVVSRQLLEQEPYFLYQYKLDIYQKDFTLPMPHGEAVEIIEKYKKFN